MGSFIELTKKEIYRFTSIWVQTVIGPVSTAILYQLIFISQLSKIPTGIAGVTYTEFLIPGLVMMQVLLNAFSNGSSSIIQSKYLGNIIFLLMAPITPLAIFAAYLISSIFRGILVGLFVVLGIGWFGINFPEKIWAVIYFAVIGASITAGLGIIIGVISDKFDKLAGYQSFIIIPLIYLAGIFFNTSSFSGLWYKISLLDPFLYIVDGFRYGFIAHSNVNILYGASLCLIFSFIINFFAYGLIKYGIKIKK